ncbi:MAG: hypothetical protein ACKOQM_13655, partial [Novosphingobium sp.]
ARRRADHAEGDGQGKPRLPGGMVMATKLRWADRDAGQRLSIVMMILFLVAGTALMAIVGFKKLTSGPTSTDVAVGLAMLGNVVWLLYGALRRWRQHDAG